MATQIIYTQDHPRANHGMPQPGDEEYEVMLISESGDPITLRMGPSGYADLKRRLRWWRVRARWFWPRDPTRRVRKASHKVLWGASETELDLRAQVFGRDLRADRPIGAPEEIKQQVDALTLTLINQCHEQVQEELCPGTVYEIRVIPHEDFIQVTWRATYAMQDKPLEKPAGWQAAEGFYRMGRYKVEEA